MPNSQYRYSTHGSAAFYCGHYREAHGYFTDTLTGVPDWVLIYTMGGTGLFKFDNSQILVTAGDVLLTKPYTPMHYRTAPGGDRWELSWAHFQPRPQWLEWLQWPEVDPGTMLATNLGHDAATEVGKALYDMNRLAVRSTTSRFHLVMNALERAILWAGGADGQRGFDSRVTAAIEFMLAHIGEKVTVDAVCAAVKLSPSRLGHVFRDQTGKTPLEFLEGERIARAREQLRVTNRTIGAIALDLGYENPFYFTRRFVKLTGISPSAYRRSPP